MNLSDYYSLISEDKNKLLPSTSLLKDIQDAIDFNEKLKNETNKVGIIVSSTFLTINNFQLGKLSPFYIQVLISHQDNILQNKFQLKS